MKARTFAISILVLSLSCQSPDTNSTAPTQTVVDGTTLKFKPLPMDRWSNATLPTLGGYPGLAHLAHISGTLVMHANVESNGRVFETKLISGPPQLAGYLDHYIKNIEFHPNETDQPGPWSISITGLFVLGGQIGIGPSGSKIELKKVPVVQVAFPR